jgi:hypothetical protein
VGVPSDSREIVAGLLEHFGLAEYSGSPQITRDEAIISTNELTSRQSGARLRNGHPRPYIGVMNLELSDEETATLTQELHDIVENDRYPFSPRIRTLRGILAKLRPEPAREPLPAPKVYAAPRAKRTRRLR